MRSLELFSGCGGLAKGLEQAGFHHCAFIEFNKWACKSLRENFDPKLVHEMDVRNFDFHSVGKVDIVAGGPPCQPFSLGGLAKAQEDTRDMFPEAIRAIHDLKPKCFVFENVKGLLRKSFSDYFSYIVLRLTFPDCTVPLGKTWQEHLAVLREIENRKYKGLKYDVRYKLVNAVDYGVPQNRERVFIVGFRSDLNVSWEWPRKSSRCRTIADVIGRLPNALSANGIVDHFVVPGAREYAGHTGSDYNSPSKTIKAGAHGVPGGENMIRFPDGSLRYMTIHEAKLIQTFPDDYVICGAWGEAMRQIGNAVPVDLAKRIGDSLIEALKRKPNITTDSIIEIPSDKHYEQMRFLDHDGIYVIGNNPLTLFASYHRDCRTWILKNGLYNYPITKKKLEQDGRILLAKKLLLQNRRSKPLYFDVESCQLVTRRQLEAHGYPRRGSHGHYVLFSIVPVATPVPTFNEDDFSLLFGRGYSYEKFTRIFSHKFGSNKKDRTKVN